MNVCAFLAHVLKRERKKYHHHLDLLSLMSSLDRWTPKLRLNFNLSLSFSCFLTHAPVIDSVPFCSFSLRFCVYVWSYCCYCSRSLFGLNKNKSLPLCTHAHSLTHSTLLLTFFLTFRFDITHHLCTHSFAVCVCAVLLHFLCCRLIFIHFLELQIFVSRLFFPFSFSLREAEINCSLLFNENRRMHGARC